MVLWLILMSASSNLSFHYNSITAPFTGHCNSYTGPRVGKGSWGQSMCIIYVFLKEQYKTKLLHNRVLNKKLDYCFINSVMESEVTNAIIVWSLIRSTELSNSDASAVMPVTNSDLVSLFSPPFSHSFIPHSAPNFFSSTPFSPFPVHQTLSMPT